MLTPVPHRAIGVPPSSQPLLLRSHRIPVASRLGLSSELLTTYVVLLETRVFFLLCRKFDWMNFASCERFSEEILSRVVLISPSIRETAELCATLMQ